MYRLILLFMTITTFFSCKKLFKNVLKVEVENKTNITKNIQLHTVNSSVN